MQRRPHFEKTPLSAVTYTEAHYNGSPTHELAELAKNDLAVCVGCCEAELQAFTANQFRVAPAPFFFERASVLLSKAKEWEELVYWAEAYLNALEVYRQHASDQSAKVWLSPKVEKLRERLEKARLKLKEAQK